MGGSVIYSRTVSDNQSQLFEAIASAIKEAGIGSVVVASTKGKTALKLAEALAGIAKVVSVTEFTYPDDIKSSMKKMGVTAIERTDLPIHDRRDAREALLSFGAGVKAALEVAVIATGRGAVQGDRVLAVAGSGGAIDTALIVKPVKPEDLDNPDPSKRISVLDIIALPAKE